MRNHEKEYIQNVAADLEIDDFGAKDLEEIEALGDVNWVCVAKCYIDYRLCRLNGGSQEECRLKMAKCLLDCKK